MMYVQLKKYNSCYNSLYKVISVNTGPTPWLDSTLRAFQDNIGTVPATANNDPVVLWKASDGVNDLHCFNDPADYKVDTTNGIVAVNDPSTGNTSMGGSITHTSDSAFEVIIKFKDISQFESTHIFGLSINNATTSNIALRENIDVNTQFIVDILDTIGNDGITLDNAGAPNPLGDNFYYVRIAYSPGTPVTAAIYNSSGVLIASGTASRNITLGAADDNLISMDLFPYYNQFFVRKVWLKMNGTFTNTERNLILTQG
jgi:hypothetical protein